MIATKIIAEIIVLYKEKAEKTYKWIDPWIQPDTHLSTHGLGFDKKTSMGWLNKSFKKSII